MKSEKTKIPSPLLSLVPVIMLAGLLFFVISIFGSSALDGGSQIALLLASSVCILIALFYCKIKWTDIENTISNYVKGVTPAILILLIIGALSGAWMISGIVPTFIYYGIQLIHPNFYLVSTCVICSFISVLTGSSWSTIATIGVALLGIGQALGFSNGWIAGAIISGAYFGDKMSPLSDTTILASSVTRTPLFKHIRYLFGTTTPSMILTLIIFTIAGFSQKNSSHIQIDVYLLSLKETFNISLWLMIVPVATGLMIAKRLPSIVTLFLSAILAGLFALFFQPEILFQISGNEIFDNESKLKGLLITFYGATGIDSGDLEINELISTRGMSGMMSTVWLIICAMCFGGSMMASGMLKSITSVLILFMKRTVGLVTTTVISGIFFNLATADQYISIILTGNMYRDIYREKGYESRLLGRTIEDAVTVTSPLVPWNTCGMMQTAILGISTFVYFPFCFFNIISPLMSIVVAVIRNKRLTPSPSPMEYSLQEKRVESYSSDSYTNQS